MAGNRQTYLTVADELVEYADVAKNYLREKSYTIKIEPQDLSFPFTPTFIVKMGHTRIICDIQGKINTDRINSWVQYARTCNTDTRVVVIFADSVRMRTADEQRIAALGVGILICSTTNCYEKLAPKDQAINVELPKLSSLPARVRRVLAPSYEKFDRGDWRECFKTACQAFEVAAREYLKKGIELGRIQLVTKNGNISTIGPGAIDKLTQGQLAEHYSRIVGPNKVEATIEQALKRLNKDRVAAIHHEKKPTTESRLRRNVGQHMLVIINALKSIL